jgi:hypothetical protein
MNPESDRKEKKRGPTQRSAPLKGKDQELGTQKTERSRKKQEDFAEWSTCKVECSFL